VKSLEKEKKTLTNKESTISQEISLMHNKLEKLRKLQFELKKDDYNGGKPLIGQMV
jgi:hypothetical protein